MHVKIAISGEILPISAMLFLDYVYLFKIGNTLESYMEEAIEQQQWKPDYLGVI